MPKKKTLNKNKKVKNVKQKSLKAKSNKKIIFATVILLVAIIVIGLLSFLPCKYKKFYIVSPNGNKKAVLKLEIADTDATRIKGLMGRKSLNKNTGMLFDFKVPGYYEMWMKNTLIPLDMLFINQYGQVISLAPNRKPMSEKHINLCSIQYEKLKKTKKMKLSNKEFMNKCEAFIYADIIAERLEYLPQYVIELPAGTIKDNAILVNDILLK